MSKHSEVTSNSKVDDAKMAKKETPNIKESSVKDTAKVISKDTHPKVEPTDKSVEQGTPGEIGAISKPDPEIAKVSREDKSLSLDLHDNTKEKEHFEQKPAKEKADINTAVNAATEKERQAAAGGLPERSTEDQKIITSEKDGKEMVVGVQSRAQVAAEEKSAQISVNIKDTAVSSEPTPMEKTIQKLNEKSVVPVKIAEDDKDAKLDEKIVKFLSGGKKGDYVKINDFLKTLYPAKKGNEPNVWEQLGEGKRLRVLLDAMQSHGLIDVQGNRHSVLGTTYYEGQEQFSRIHNLSTVDIYAKVR